MRVVNSHSLNNLSNNMKNIIEKNIIEKDNSLISVERMVEQLNLDDDLVNNDYLINLIDVAVEWVEDRINTIITPTTVQLICDNFTGNLIEIEHGGINYLDKILINNEEFTDYQLIKYELNSKIILNKNLNKDKINITYIAGNNAKKKYIQASIIKASDLFDTERSDYSTNLTNNNIVMRLLNLM